MKKISMLFCVGVLISALCVTFVACNNEPEDIGITPVPESDVPEEVSAFFKKNLPPRSDTYPYAKLEPEFKFGEIDFNYTECFMINSMEEFKALASPSLELPSIDFEKHTLIIGQHWMGTPGFDLVKQTINAESDEMILNLIYKEHEGGIPQITAIFYFWGLYPKLPGKPIHVDIITI